MGKKRYKKNKETKKHSSSGHKRLSSPSKPLWTLNCHLLLYLYALIPMIGCLVAIDYFFLNQQILEKHLPVTPYEWAFWTIIFATPHIVGSVITLADKEYLQHYNRRLYLPLMIIAPLVLMVPWLLGDAIFFIILAFYTMYHVLTQQFGLALMMLGKRPETHFSLWKWLSVTAAFSMYVIVFGKQYLEPYHVFDIPLIDLLPYAIGLLLLGAVYPAFKIVQTPKTRVGVWFLWGNVVMVSSCYVFLLLGYTVFVILIPRVIHDVTAFLVYGVHDQNRNSPAPKNFFYRLVHFTQIPPALLCPILSIGVAYYAFHYDHKLIVTMNYIIAFFHYHLESFVWKGNSLHRQYVPFVQQSHASL